MAATTLAPEIHSIDSTREYNADQKIEDPFQQGFSVPVASFFELN